MNKYLKFKEDFDVLVKKASSIVITSHISPDDDSISSVLATYYYLTESLKLTKPIRMIYAGDDKYVHRYSYFRNFNKIKFVKNIVDHIRKDDLVIVLDVQELARCTDKPETVMRVENEIICIDHHVDKFPEKYALLFNEGLSSNAETLYKLFFEPYLKNLKREICEILLLGILGDTGNFIYVNDRNAGVFEVAMDLVKHSRISIEELTSKYDKAQLRELQIFGLYIRNSQLGKVEDWPVFLYSYVDGNDLEGYSNVEIGGGTARFKSYLKKTIGANWGFAVRPRPRGDYAISFRAVPGSVNVRLIAEGMRIGGGHNLAAGGMFKKDTVNKVCSAHEAIEKVMEYLKTHKPVYI